MLRRQSLPLGALLLGAPFLLSMDAVPPRATPADAGCAFTSAPALSGVTAMASPQGRVTLSWSAAPPGSVVVTRQGSDRSTATFPQTAATVLNDVTVSPFVSRYTYTLQPVNCFGQGRPATASVTMPPFHLLVTYDGGNVRPGVPCSGDCALAALNVVTSCGIPGATPYLAGCDFSGVLLHKGFAIDAAHPLPAGAAACSSTTVLPPADGRLEQISGIVVKGGASAPWKGTLVTRATFGQMANGPAPWGSTDLTGTLRLVYQCPAGTLTP